MCKITAEAVVADGAAVGAALNNLGAAEQASNPTLAGELESAGKAVIAATGSWQQGNALTDVTDAENAAIAVLDVIPETSTFAPLAAIAFAAINLLISNAETQSTQTGVATADAHTLLTHAATRVSPWQGKAKIEHNPFHSVRKNFENTWNKAAKPLGVKEITL
jgi:hypothetical protein